MILPLHEGSDSKMWARSAVQLGDGDVIVSGSGSYEFGDPERDSPTSGSRV